MKFKVWPDRIKLLDSYKVSKYDMFAELESVRMETFGSGVWKRPMRELYFEICVHNALYALGIRREKTADCDLNVSLPWYARFAYKAFGMVVWPFIK